MSANDTRSLHFAVGPDDYLDFYHTCEVQLFGKVRVLRFSHHLDPALGSRGIALLRAQKECCAASHAEDGEQTHCQYSLCLIHYHVLKAGNSGEVNTRG